MNGNAVSVFQMPSLPTRLGSQGTYLVYTNTGVHTKPKEKADQL